MIGKILRVGDLLMDALAELEGALSIRIIHIGGSGWTDSGLHFSSYLGASIGSGGVNDSRATGANDENLNIINRGPMCSINAVHRLSTEESGYCFRDTNPIEYLYGGLVLMTQSHRYNPSRQEAHEE